MAILSSRRTGRRWYLVILVLCLTFTRSSLALDRNKKKNEPPKYEKSKTSKSKPLWFLQNKQEKASSVQDDETLKPEIHPAIKTKVSVITKTVSKFPIPLSKVALWGVSLGGIIYVKRHAMEMAQYIHERWIETLLKLASQLADGEINSDLNKITIENITIEEQKDSSPFNETLTCEVAQHVQNVAHMGMYLYGAHVVSEIMRVLSDKPLLPEGLLLKVTKATYTLYGAWQIQQNYRREIIGKVLDRDPDASWGKVEIYDRFSTIILVLMTAISVTNTFGINLVAALAPFIAVAGLGTTVLAFAAQDIAGNLIAGLALATSDKFQEGDTIEVKTGSDIVSGVVDDIGWLDTAVRGADEVVLKMPNSVFPKARLSNKSRDNNSRVVQTLTFSYNDMDKIPRLVQGIKQKLIENCPELISDGSRPLVVTWSGFQENYLEVLVDARFNIAPMGEAYHVNKQRVMESIAQAVKENDVLFAKATRPQQSKSATILSDITEITMSSSSTQRVDEDKNGQKVATPL